MYAMSSKVQVPPGRTATHQQRNRNPRPQLEPQMTCLDKCKIT